MPRTDQVADAFTVLPSFLRSLFTLSAVPPRWRLPVYCALGVAAGLGLTVAHVSRATSYLSDAPEACVNCHVMTTQYATWQRSSHARVATCNDCHVPHDTLLNKYAFKARDGMYHSTIFTLRLEPQAIQMSAAAIPVVEANCRRCHGAVIEETHMKYPAVQAAKAAANGGEMRCWDCHREVPHGRTRSLSAVPRVMTPRLPAPLQSLENPTIGGRAPRPESTPTNPKEIPSNE